MAVAVTIDVMKPTTLAFVVPGVAREYGLKSPLNPLFFFQAEDGIRDLYMTGVQTCALPISRGGRGEHQVGSLVPAVGTLRDHSSPRRSEERRVGKECRSRWSPYH